MRKAKAPVSPWITDLQGVVADTHIGLKHILVVLYDVCSGRQGRSIARSPPFTEIRPCLRAPTHSLMTSNYDIKLANVKPVLAKMGQPFLHPTHGLLAHSICLVWRMFVWCSTQQAIAFGSLF
jgi:hypothetical protein